MRKRHVVLMAGSAIAMVAAPMAGLLPQAQAACPPSSQAADKASGGTVIKSGNVAVYKSGKPAAVATSGNIGVQAGNAYVEGAGQASPLGGHLVIKPNKNGYVVQKPGTPTAGKC